MLQRGVHSRRIHFRRISSIPFMIFFDSDGVSHIAIPVTAFTTLRDFFYPRATRLASYPRCVSSARNLR